MPDENMTETTRSDATRSHDVLFGDAPEETAAAVAEDPDSKEHGTNGEADKAQQEPEAGEDKADTEAETDSAEELKVVVAIKGDRATIGVKGTASDPYIESFDDPDLSGLAQEVPAVLERARAKWEDTPMHPGRVKPTPPAKRRNRGQQGSAAQATATEEAERIQPEAPRLF